MNNVIGHVTGINGMHFVLRCDGESLIIKVDASCSGGLPMLRSAMQEQRAVQIFYREHGLTRGARAHRIEHVELAG